MIVTEFYRGQGLGNQLWCYVTTRVIALARGYDFGIKSPERFKGLDFMDLDFGAQVFGGDGPEGGPPDTLPRGIAHYYRERGIVHRASASDIRTTDEALSNIPDNTKIDGLMQDARLVAPHKESIRQWLAVDPAFERHEYASDDICVINFRGGGYTRDKDFFLPRTYWKNAIEHMRTINPQFTFVVITDDVKTAKTFFPHFDVFHFSIGEDYSVIKNAHYLILSNSSFAWFPAWLNQNLKYCIAPKYWARHNISDGYWSLGYNITPGWMYQDRDGVLHDYESCREELDDYMRRHAHEHIVEVPPSAAAQYTAAPIKPIGTFSLARRALRTIDYKTRISIKHTLFRIRRRITELQAKNAWLSPQEIGAYRKNIKVYDVFTFFNELDLLEIRLNILDPYVDYFVIVEATETFSGHTKPLYFQENRDRFKKWGHKIIHLAIDDTPADADTLRSRLHVRGLSRLDKQIIADTLTSDNVGKDNVAWLKEFYQKECIKKALTSLRDDDFCFVSDLDEIWNPELLVDYSRDDVYKLRQIGYQYFLNNRSNESDWGGWTGTIATKYKNIKHACLNHLRTQRKMRWRYTFLHNGGWHFAFQGGYEGARSKLETYQHFAYNPDETIPQIEDRVRLNRDHRGRTHIRLRKDERGLPKYVLDNKDRYKKFFRK